MRKSGRQPLHPAMPSPLHSPVYTVPSAAFPPTSPPLSTVLSPHTCPLHSILFCNGASSVVPAKWRPQGLSSLSFLKCNKDVTLQKQITVAKMATPRCSILVIVGTHELFTRHEAPTLPRPACPMPHDCLHLDTRHSNDGPKATTLTRGW